MASIQKMTSVRCRTFKVVKLQWVLIWKAIRMVSMKFRSFQVFSVRVGRENGTWLAMFSLGLNLAKCAWKDGVITLKNIFWGSWCDLRWIRDLRSENEWKQTKIGKRLKLLKIWSPEILGLRDLRGPDPLVKIWTLNTKIAQKVQGLIGNCVLTYMGKGLNPSSPSLST